MRGLQPSISRLRLAGLVTLLLTAVGTHGVGSAQYQSPDYPQVNPTELPKGLTILPWRLGVSSDYDGRSGSSDQGSARPPARSPQGNGSRERDPGNRP